MLTQNYDTDHSVTVNLRYVIINLVILADDFTYPYIHVCVCVCVNGCISNQSFYNSIIIMVNLGVCIVMQQSFNMRAVAKKTF